MLLRGRAFLRPPRALRGVGRDKCSISVEVLHPKALTSRLSNARSAVEILELHGAHMEQFNGMHMGAAWNKLGKLAGFEPLWATASPSESQRLEDNYQIRRTAADFNIALVTNPQVFETLASALKKHSKGDYLADDPKNLSSYYDDEAIAA